MRMMRLMRVGLVFAPVLVLAQATAKPVEKKAVAAPAMQHDMSKMKSDTAMKHDMSKMVHDTAMKHDMSKMGGDSGMKHKMGGMGKGMGMGMGMGMGSMKSGWGELDAFHSLLMSTWHPAQKDSLAMARAMAPTLVASAEAWAKSNGPAACDNAAARKALPGIVADAKAYANTVSANGNDAAVKSALKKVHDGFEVAGAPCVHAAMKAKGGMAMEKMPAAKKNMNEMDHSKMDHSAPSKKP